MKFQLTELFWSTDTIVKKVTQLKVSDPRDVKKCISRSNKYFKKQLSPEKKDLHSILSDKFTLTRQQAYDKLLRLSLTKDKNLKTI